MSSGQIRRYNSGRGFGFITPDEGGADVFVHVRGLAPGTSQEELAEGTPVTYDTELSEKGVRAVNVAIVRDGPYLPDEETLTAVRRAIEEFGAMVLALRKRGWDV